MANIIRRGDGGQAVSPGTMGELEPFRRMREFLRSMDPFRELVSFFPFGEREMGFNPYFDVKETKDSYVFMADMPGVKEKDLDISLTGNRLVISGKREAEKEEKTDTYYASERTYGSFTRAFTLPEGTDTDKVQAELKDGVLRLTLPKKAESKAKKITINPQSQAKA